MSGTMNGAPYYSPPHRHQKSYASRLGSLAEDVLKPELAELPALVASAIRQGLIKRPAPSETIPVPVKAELADWRIANCQTCGASFERGRWHLMKCAPCRLPIRTCSGCGKDFRPPDRKKVCCSKECSQKKQVANFKQQHALTAKPRGMVQCCICKGMRPEPKRGARIAQTCSKECLLTLRKQMNQKTK
jgi:hypothetical protein